MKRDMKQWLSQMLEAPVKKAMPVLSFPAVQLMDVSARERSIRLTEAAASVR